MSLITEKSHIYRPFFQPAPDKVRAVSFQRPAEDLPDNGGGFLVHQQMVFVLRVFLIPERGDTAGKLALLGFQKVRGMYLLGNILAVHLVEDVLERRNVVILPRYSGRRGGERSPQ